MQTYDEFETNFLARHEQRMTSWLSTAGDVLWLGSAPLGIVTRDIRVFVGVFAAGTVVATVAHFFQPGTVRDEWAALLRHPFWAARAEMVRHRAGGSPER